jgi:hypothetical protein
MESTYTLTHSELIEVFKRWNDDVKSNPSEFRTYEPDETWPTGQAQDFVKYLKQIQVTV